MAEKRVFSKDQTSAIETRDRTLLVSAAAGSGKTTTLTERIIRSLLDEKNPASLQNMLIVTFTNASVGDLVKKIGEALESAVREHPDNKRLERELYLLPNAKIRTIDAFCNEILRANTDKIGVPPNYRIAEEAEIRILSESLLNTLIGAAYDGSLEEHGISPKEFEALCDSLTDTKSTGSLSEIFAFLYEKSKNAIDGVGIFEKLANIYLQIDGNSVENTIYGRDLMALTEECKKYLCGICLTITQRLVRGSESEVRDAAAYTALAGALRDIPCDKYSTAREAILSFSFPGMPACSADEKTDNIIKYRNVLTSVKSIFNDLRDRFYQYDTDMWQKLFSELYSTLITLSKFMSIFDKAYVGEKLRRSMLEYSDIEKFAYDCLYNPDGTLTEVAKAYRGSLCAVYIDEYQDVNELQDAIFAALSNGKNRFMVGDIKQSIYVFRSAKPEIFASMKDSFKRLDGFEDSTDGATIFMSENYRCDKGIIDFVNGVFDRMFSAVKESIGYVAEDRLTFAKKYKNGITPEYFRTEIDIVERPDKEDEEKSASPKYVASRIAELIKCGRLADGSPISPSDIAIVLRKRDGIGAFADALEELGIKADRGVDKSFFMNSEIRLVLCLLNAIDNPSKDIYLAGLMCSPIFNFTADEMLRYRHKSSERTLYRSILKYAEENPEQTKLCDFLSKLSHYRALSEGMHVYDLIRRLYRECGLLALAGMTGSRDNLMMLYNYARKYESSSYKGLYNFITYINNIVTMGESIDEKSDTGEGDSVKITTVHSSKGLEYPIVFFAEASRAFSNRDLRGRVAYCEGYGMAYYMRTQDGLALSENPVKHIIHEKMKEKFFEEELRVLYVALTRAKERLYVVGDLPLSTTFDEYVERAKIKAESLSSYSMRHYTSYLEMMLASGAEADVMFIPSDEVKAPEFTEVQKPEQVETEVCSEERDEELYGILLDRFSYEYPDRYKTDFPEKMSVSRLYPTVLDGNDDTDVIGEVAEGEVVRRRTLPSFISGTEADESAERGIATHMVLQFCDLENLKNQGAETEVKRLAEKKFLSDKNVSMIRMPEIDLFVKSELFEQMYNAKKIWRELRFNSRLDATLFTEDKERAEALDGTTVLVQGVIDCIIEDASGELHLVDYKTDRLSREEFKNIALAEKKMNDKHALQLTYYSLAIEKMFGKRPKTVRVYSMPLGRCVDIKTKY